MDTNPCPSVPCALCNRPVDLQKDLCADENGKAVHSECYVGCIVKRKASMHKVCGPFRSL